MKEKVKTLFSTIGGTVFLFSFGVIGLSVGVRILTTWEEYVQVGIALIIVASLILFVVMFGSVKIKRLSDPETPENTKLEIKEHKKEMTLREQKLQELYTMKADMADINEDAYKIDPNSPKPDKSQVQEIGKTAMAEVAPEASHISDESIKRVRDEMDAGLAAFDSMDESDSLPGFGEENV